MSLGATSYHLFNIKNMRSVHEGVLPLVKLQALAQRISYAFVGVTHYCALFTEVY